jgi:ornithine carbamoyltransferase
VDVTRQFRDVDDFSPAELETVLGTATDLKERFDRGDSDDPLANRTLAMLFEKPSTRTRVSFETGMTQLGGHAIFLGPEDVGLGGREPIRDLSRTISRYADAVMVRLFDHADVEEFCASATVPVVNGLTDLAHPCQTLADLLTIRKHLASDFDASVTWIGDGNNVARSFAVGCGMVGLDCTICTPAEYAIEESVLDRARTFDAGGSIETTTDPREAAVGADVVYTDVWVSMGEEAQREEKLAAFKSGDFQVNDALLDSGTEILHCLPAHRGEEISEPVFESDRSLVWEQAENRLHAQKGLLTFLLDAA